MEAGLISAVVMLVMSPFIIWHDRSKHFQTLNPVEQNLQRASHGFTLMVFVLLVGWLVGRHLTNVWSALILVGLFVYGLVRFLVGVKRSAGMKDRLLAARAAVKIGVGIVAFAYMRTTTFAGDGSNFFLVIVWFLGVGAALWCIFTGAVRVLLTIGIQRKRETPELHPSPRGAARDATPAEAKAAMRGKGGGRKISLDDMTF